MKYRYTNFEHECEPSIVLWKYYKMFNISNAIINESKCTFHAWKEWKLIYMTKATTN